MRCMLCLRDGGGEGRHSVVVYMKQKCGLCKFNSGTIFVKRENISYSYLFVAGFTLCLCSEWRNVWLLR